MHATLQKFFEQAQGRSYQAQGNLFSAEGPLIPQPIKTLVSLQELIEFYRRCWIDEWYLDSHQKQDYFKHGEEILKVFYNSEGDKTLLPLKLEHPFRCTVGKNSLKGVMDRIDPTPSGGVEIIDYKTGAPKSLKNLNFEDREQLFLYALAYKQLYAIMPETLTFYFLENNERVSFTPTEEDLTRTAENIQASITGMSQQSFPAQPGYHCRNCDYYNICEFRQNIV